MLALHLHAPAGRGVIAEDCPGLRADRSSCCSLWPWPGQAFEHDGYHCEFSEALSDDGDGFVVRHQAAVAPYPGEGALDNPAPPDELEPAFLVRALDDLQSNLLTARSAASRAPL